MYKVLIYVHHYINFFFGMVFIFVIEIILSLMNRENLLLPVLIQVYFVSFDKTILYLVNKDPSNEFDILFC